MKKNEEFSVLWESEVKALAEARIGALGVLIYCVLIRYSRLGDTCFPSMDAIRNATGPFCTERAYWKALKALRVAGMVIQSANPRSKTRFLLPYRTDKQS